jgi:hypothetical protein
MNRKYKKRIEGRWVEVTEAEFTGTEPVPTTTKGLGDLVAAVAQPIARAIDAAAGTNISNCGGCKKRRELLNRIHL